MLQNIKSHIALASKVISFQSLNAEPQIKTQRSDIPQDILENIKGLGIKIGTRLLREIRNHSPQKVRSAIAAFEQYRSKTVVDSPGGCLLKMIQDEAEPNVSQQPTTPQEDEFECWYQEAISVGFCQDLLKNYLPIQQGQIMVRVTKDNNPAGYELMPWRDAKALMESS